MKSYTKIYLDFFDYTITDKIICEVCKEKIANDLHHIYSRKKAKSKLNEISNLVALCRECHDKFGDKVQYYKMFDDLIKKRHGTN